MSRLSLFVVAILGTLAWPAAAADLGVRPPLTVPAAPPLLLIKAWPQPFYLVNQGPEFSGPGLVIAKLGYRDTDVQRAYPFIGGAEDLIVPPALELRGSAPAGRSAMHAAALMRSAGLAAQLCVRHVERERGGVRHVEALDRSR